jgi:hypothetical protein
LRPTTARRSDNIHSHVRRQSSKEIAMSTHPDLVRVAPDDHLIGHDVRFERKRSASGALLVIATIDCERQGCRIPVDVCRECPRFARIDVHEAGYVMLCRSADRPLEE